MTEQKIALELHLGGKLLGSAYPSLLLSGIAFSKHLKNLVEELLAKHKEAISGSAEKPMFTLSGFSSAMNHFVPLQHGKFQA